MKKKLLLLLVLLLLLPLVAMAESTTDTPVISDVKLVEQGQLVYPGATLTLTATVIDLYGVDEMSAVFSLEGEEPLMTFENLVPEKNGDTYTVKLTIPQDITPGLYMFDVLRTDNTIGNTGDISGNDIALLGAEHPVFTVIDPEATPVLSNVKLAQQNQLVRPGDTLTLSATVIDPYGINEMRTVFSLEGEEPLIKFENLVPQKNGDTYTVNFTLPQDITPGLYMFDVLGACNAIDNWGKISGNDIAQLGVEHPIFTVMDTTVTPAPAATPAPTPAPTPKPVAKVEVVETIEDVPVVEQPVAVLPSINLGGESGAEEAAPLR